MLGLNHHAHAVGLEHVLDGLGDLGGELFLDLQAMGEALHHPRQLGDAHHAVGRQVADMGAAHHRQHVVLAEANHADVAEHDQLVIAANLFEGALQIGAWLLAIAGEQFAVGARDAGGGFQQTFAVGIVARPADQGAHRRLGFGLGRTGGWSGLIGHVAPPVRAGYGGGAASSQRLYCAAQVLRSAFRRPMGADQSAARSCRSSRMLGYQGLSARVSSQRQSGT